MKRSIGLAWLCLLMCLSGCKQEWCALIYPNPENPSVRLEVGEYDTPEACDAAAREALKHTPSQGGGSYQCGLNCEFSAHVGDYVCERLAS